MLIEKAGFHAVQQDIAGNLEGLSVGADRILTTCAD
jgi:hypothetical protein